MKLLLLTDIHAWADTNYPNRKWAAYINCFGSTFESSVLALQEAARLVDIVVNLGDFIHQTSREDDITQYKSWIKLLDSLGKPVLHVAWNHDLVYLEREILASLWYTERLYYFRDIGGYRHIVLDGNREGNKNGIIIDRNQRYRFDEAQLVWLQTVLNESNTACIVYSHFPIDDQDLSQNYYWPENPEERAFPLGYREVRWILEKSEKVIAVFSGHTHFSHRITIWGIEYFTVGSFAENDGNGKPTREYSIAHFEGCNLEITSTYL